MTTPIKPIRTTEIRSTDEFAAFSDCGLHYTIVEKTRIDSVSYPDASIRLTSRDRWYQTVSGQLVNQHGDALFEIASTGLKLRRADAGAPTRSRGRALQDRP